MSGERLEDFETKFKNEQLVINLNIEDCAESRCKWELLTLKADDSSWSHNPSTEFSVVYVKLSEINETSDRAVDVVVHCKVCIRSNSISKYEAIYNTNLNISTKGTTSIQLSNISTNQQTDTVVFRKRSKYKWKDLINIINFDKKIKTAVKNQPLLKEILQTSDCGHVEYRMPLTNLSNFSVVRVPRSRFDSNVSDSIPMIDTGDSEFVLDQCVCRSLKLEMIKDVIIAEETNKQMECYNILKNTYNTDEGHFYTCKQRFHDNQDDCFRHQFKNVILKLAEKLENTQKNPFSDAYIKALFELNLDQFKEKISENMQKLALYKRILCFQILFQKIDTFITSKSFNEANREDVNKTEKDLYIEWVDNKLTAEGTSLKSIFLEICSQYSEVD